MRNKLAAVLVAVMLTMAWAVVVFADAGNPITGSINGTITGNDTIGWTVNVRGQWNWLSHTTDCNFDRAATGVGMVWNDPNEPGFTVAKGSVSAGVGVASKLNGDTYNVIDQMVHPADIGNDGVSPNLPGAAGQQFADPAPILTNANLYKTWFGGCGREPLTLAPFAGHPWGSWGYDKNPDSATGGGIGYSHTYVHRSDITSVCANFYDVHGGGKAGTSSFQVPNGNKEITVNGNGDNSIQTNAFNVTDGANCIFFPLISTHASGGTFAADGTLSLSDVVTLSGASKTATGTITVKMYGPADSTCSNGAVGTVNKTLTQVSGDVNHDYTASFSVSTKGVYNFTADLFFTGSTTADASSPCGAANETATALRRPTSLTTNAGTTFVVGDTTPPTVGLTDTATLSGGTSDGTGTITFELFKGACPGTSQGTASATVNNGANGKDYTSSPALSVGPGQYHWVASYSGDDKNAPTATTCGDANENPLVIQPKIDVSKSPASQSVTLGGTANFSITVTNIGDSTLINVATTDAQAPGCARSNLGTLAPGASTTYTCTFSPVTTPFVNVVFACGTDVLGNSVCDTDTNGGNPPPGCDPLAEANRCASVGIETLASKQDFKPADTATVSGATNPNGNMTFSLYKGTSCVQANLIYTDTQLVNSSGTASTASSQFLSQLIGSTNTAGTYSWQISYSGDTNNNGDVHGACGTENFVVTNG